MGSTALPIPQSYGLVLVASFISSSLIFPCLDCKAPGISTSRGTPSGSTRGRTSEETINQQVATEGMVQAVHCNVLHMRVRTV